MLISRQGKQVKPRSQGLLQEYDSYIRTWLTWPCSAVVDHRAARNVANRWTLQRLDSASHSLNDFTHVGALTCLFCVSIVRYRAKAFPPPARTRS